MSPAQLVCQKFGGASQLAMLLNLRPASITYWETQGAGRIPSKYHVPLLKLAAKHNVHLTPNDLVLGSRD